MSKVGETFFTSVGCMDGRVHKPVVDFGRKVFSAHFADTITEAGLAGLLTKEFIDVSLLKSLKKKIFVSLEKHHSKGIIVHGHQECAGNPVEDDIHKEDIKRTVEVVKLLVDSSVPVVGIFVKRAAKSDNGAWEVEEISQN